VNDEEKTLRWFAIFDPPTLKCPFSLSVGRRETGERVGVTRLSVRVSVLSAMNWNGGD